MSLGLENYKFSYRNAKNKPVFVPNDYTRDLASKIISLVSDLNSFEPYYFHFRKGSHVAALHEHRQNRFFARIDLKNFFYSVGRNRVKSSPKRIGINQAEHFSRWSTVKNPYGTPAYALPYGFPQSPILASLVLQKSKLGSTMAALPPHILRSVYIDDIAISSNDLPTLLTSFQSLLDATVKSGFYLNDDKTSGPATAMTLFNCDLTHQKTAVSDARIAIFDFQHASQMAAAAFENYCASVQDGNL